MKTTKDLEYFIRHSIAFASCEQVKEICKDFFKETGLTYYNYVRVYNDESRISLTNNKKWATYVFTHHSKYKLITEEIAPKGSSWYVIWDNDEDYRNDPLFTIAREKYNIAHGFTITTAYKGYIELQFFGTRKNNPSINNFYINNLAIFNKFAAFFREKAFNLIGAAEKEKLLLAGHNVLWLEKDARTDKIKLNKKPFENKVTRFYLSGEHKNIYLTTREAQCLTALIEGLNAKETGKLFKISFRTVQIHLMSVSKSYSVLNAVS